MSRSYGSYDANWQRRKSMLIRSLFHDIPILSPVEEESSDSYYVPTQEVFRSPPRPYSPLPPLIIEKVPITNKHDEPEEYYSKLYKKIKRIYKKLFIEKRNFSSIASNYNDSSYDDASENNSDGSVENLDFHFLESNSPDNGNFDAIIEDREARTSSVSTKSNGYGADFESMDTAIIDVVNYTPSNEDGTMRQEEEESDSENIDEDGIRNEDTDNSRSSENKESSRERIDDPEFSGGEESHHSIIDDHEMTESEESNEAENEQSYEKEGSDNENIDEHKGNEETSETGTSDSIRIDDPEFSGGEESRHSPIDDHEKTESEQSNKSEDEQQLNNLTKSEQNSFVKELKLKEFEKKASRRENIFLESNVEPMEGDVETCGSSEGPVYRQITTAAMVNFDGSQDAGERESPVYEDSVKSVILPTRSRRVVASRNVDERIEVLTVPEEHRGPVYRQITTAAMVHFDGSQDAGERESPVYEDSVESVILPTRSRRVVVSHNVDVDDRIEVLTVPEEHGDLKTVPPFYTHESETTEEDFEEVATPQPSAKEAGIIELRTPQADAPDEDDEEMSTPRLDAPGEDDEGIGTPRLDGLEEEDEEMSTSQPEYAEEELEVMRNPQPAARDEETKATGEDIEEMGSPHSIEQMRTPRADLSHGTIAITHRSHSGSTGEHTAVPEEPTALTPSTQDGASKNMSEIQTSNEMNEILTSIFNESRNIDGTPISGRKRKLVDKSVQAVQTSRVTWEEMRANFFVGTPKIFRLCACTDHICY